MALEAIVGSVAGEVATLIAQAIGGYLGDAWHLKDKLQKLERILYEIKSVLADAEEKQIRDEAVRKWLDALKKAAYNAEDVVDQFNYRILRGKATEALAVVGMKNTVLRRKVRNIFSSRNPIVFPMKMGRKLKNILKRIEDIESEGRRFNFVKNASAQPETAQPTRETSSFVVESDIVGRDEDREKIVTMLIENRHHLVVLPIVGMGGLGKTIMAQLIYNDPRVMNHFKLRAWVCVSDVWDMAGIIQDLIVSITGQNNNLGTLELKQHAVRKALIGNRYLIVLDDIWQEDRAEWDNLTSVLECGTDGSAIIVTTRSRPVAEITGTIQNFDLSILSEKESWTLFCNKSLAPGTEMHEELVEIGKGIVKKCGGLPLAIKMLGSSLYRKTDRRDWLKIKDSSLWNVEASDNILPALQLSYKHLPSYAKRCFAFCAIFPKDDLIEKEMLIQMWMAHGFVPSSERFVVDGHDIFNLLVQRSFFYDLKEMEEPLNVITCRMHDLVHDLAQSIVGHECKSISGGSVIVPKDVYHLSYESAELDINQMSKASPNLRTLFYRPNQTTGPLNISRHISLRVLRFDFDPQLPNLIKFVQHLRYLDLSCGMEELPESICTLHHLQTLRLYGCHLLRKLPESICTVLNLHTLDLRHCVCLSELPERINCLSALKSLLLSGCDNLRKMPADMGRMTNLKTLTTYVVCDEDGRGIEELKGIGISSIFEIFNLRCVKNPKDARQANLHSKDLHHLTLHWRGPSDSNASDTNSNIKNAEKVMKELKPPGSIKKLTIYDYNGLSFPATLWRLKSLQVLSLRGLDNLKYIIAVDNAEDDTTVQPFPALRELRLNSLECLEGWTENRNTAQALANCFPSLVYLEIKNSTFPESNISSPSGITMAVCLPPRLENLSLFSCKSPRTLILRCPASLKYLIIYGCSKLVSLTAVEQEMSQFTSHKSIQITGCGRLKSLALEMGQLDDLSISNCNELTSLETGGLTTLQNMTISDCTKLKSLATGGLTALQSLSISNFTKLTSLEAGGLTALQSLTISDCTKLKSLETGSLIALESLSISNCTKLTSLEAGGLTALQSLNVITCSELKSLETGSLTTLQSLSISDCTELTSLEMGSLVALRSLSIFKCTKLTSLVTGDLTALQRLSISNCTELTSLEMGGLTALQSLTISYCTELTSLERGSLIALESLSISNCTELTSLETGSLTALQSLKIAKCTKLKSLETGGLTALQSLSISECTKLTSLETGSLTALQHLLISYCTELTSLETGGITALQSLTISDCTKLKSLETGSLIALESLSIFNCTELTSLEAGGLTALQSLKIAKCTKLKSLETGNLTTLRSLSIFHCTELTSLKTGSLIALQSLSIFYCTELTLLVTGDLTTLQRVSICYCTKLTSLPERLLRCLSSFQRLSIEWCPELEKKCRSRGQYWHLVSNIKDKYFTVV